MENQPYIEQEHTEVAKQIQLNVNKIQQQSDGQSQSEEQIKVDHLNNNIKLEQGIKMQQEEPKFDEKLFNIPENLQQQEQKLQNRQRKTRWGQRQIKRSKIQQDAIFNPLQALYSGNCLLPITQYGQAQLQIKMQLYSDGRRRKSKWHHQIQKTFTPPMLNYISPNISLDEVQYLLRKQIVIVGLYRLDQLTSIINDYNPQDADVRSPSPQPIYDRDGRRLNTRQIRKRDQLHRQRITLIQDCMKIRPSFLPPEDYKPLKKFKKIYLTEQAANDSKSNYIGKIIGPQGQTQKIIEKRSGCKIAVRGRGANKKNKDIFQNFQPLHIIVVADNDQQLDKGVEEVQKLLNGQEDEEIKAMLQGLNSQLMGVFNDNYCDNCQQQGHRTWACPFQMKNKVQVLCSICGQTSHPTSDCPQKQAYLKKQQTDQITMLLQSQYHQFKQDLQQKPKGGFSFITDVDSKKLMAIGQDPSGQQHQGQNSVVTVKNTSVQQAGQSNLPKFQDD